jgi:Amt family ammonium transporter
MIGAVSGILVVFGVWFLDHKLYVDDPVGAVAVHMVNGIWGTLAVGLFATDTTPMYALADGDGNPMLGLFYGGGFHQLGLQLLGFVTVAAWAAVGMIIVFAIIKAIFGLRVSEEEELEGLDSTEHGLASAYSGFSIVDMSSAMMVENENTSLGSDSYEEASEAKKNASVPVVDASKEMREAGVISDSGINKVVIITKLSRYDKIKKALNALGVTGITVTQVSGCGIQKGTGEKYRGVEMDVTLLPKIKLEVVVSKIPVDSVIETAKKTLYTGKIGDGKIFVYPVSRVVKIRTGEENYDALQDVE